MSFYQKLNKPSEAPINFEKTKILPIITDQITLLQECLLHITIKEQYEVIKIAGIFILQRLNTSRIYKLAVNCNKNAKSHK